MKKFAIKLAVLSLLILPLLYLISCIVDSGLKNSRREEYDQWTDIYHSNINADLLFSGSSRTRLMMSPRIIDSIVGINSYNIGLTGWTFDMQHARLKVYLKHNKKPKYIVQNVDWEIFDRRDNLYNYWQFLPYLDDSIVLNACKNREGEFSLRELYFPLFKYNNKVELIVEGFNCYFNTGRQYRTNVYKGFYSNSASWGTAFKEFKKENPEGKASYNIRPESKQLFERFLAYCESENIKLILVFAPEYYELQQMKKHRAFSDQIKAIMKKYETEYPIHFLDYTQDSICYSTDYFYDSRHLNTRGTQVFGVKLANDIKQIIYPNQLMNVTNKVSKTEE